MINLFWLGSILLVTSIALDTTNGLSCALAVCSCMCYLWEILRQIVEIHKLNKIIKEEKKNDKDAD